MSFSLKFNCIISDYHNFVSQISEWDVCGFALNLLSQF